MRLISHLVRIALVVSLAFAIATPAAALDRRVKIVNNTNVTIVKFYGSNKGAKTWEEDILGRDVINPGTAMMINFDDGSGYCKFDFKAVFADGDVLVKKNVNICKIGTFTYNP